MSVLYQTLRPLLDSGFERISGSYWPVRLDGAEGLHELRVALRWIAATEGAFPEQSVSP